MSALSFIIFIVANIFAKSSILLALSTTHLPTATDYELDRFSASLPDSSIAFSLPTSPPLSSVPISLPPSVTAVPSQRQENYFYYYNL